MAHWIHAINEALVNLDRAQTVFVRGEGEGPDDRYQLEAQLEKDVLVVLTENMSFEAAQRG